jgi:hypothetical protein
MSTLADSSSKQKTHDQLANPLPDSRAKEPGALPHNRLYFFWDYDLSEQDIRRIVRQGDLAEKAWVISRILEYAKWEDIWRYLTVADIRSNFEQLSFRRAQDRELWAYALDRWARDAA